VVTTLLAGCAVLRPLPDDQTLDQRLNTFPRSALPIEKPVEIRWNAHQVPFIVAENDDDAAFALGLVHAHLRLGQIALYKRIASGRIAEMGGPLAVDVDAGVRTLNYAKAAGEIEANLPPETRRWLQRFVDGLNYYQVNTKQLPYEYRALALKPEPFEIRDLMTMGRLGGTDVNWLVWFSMLSLRQRDDWPEIYQRLQTLGGDNFPSFSGSEAETALLDVLSATGKSGSNSIVVSSERTGTGSALIANDPHLGINVPNTWLIAGLKTPTMHVVGLMPTGLPVFAIGRNEWISWGGTNMRAAASELVDVSALPASSIMERKEEIKVRWWPDQTVTVRETEWGPIISDVPQLRDLGLPDLALRWTGHDVSDEISAMLGVVRAKNFPEFRQALETFSLPGQNMVYADNVGNIGQLMAVRVPNRDGIKPKDIITSVEQAQALWSDVRGINDLPLIYNPKKGFLASANNRPVDGKTTVGYFFSPDDRVRRMAEFVEDDRDIDFAWAKGLQQDVYVDSSVLLRDAIVEALARAAVQPENDEEARVLDAIRDWDGYYHADAFAPVAFETFRFGITNALLEAKLGEEDASAVARFGQLKILLAEELATIDADDLRPMLQASLVQAADVSVSFETWGEMHRLQLRHPLAFLPLIGKRFMFSDFPISGSTESLMKTAHSTTLERHRTRYGANARHISDMADLDRNYFVLLGGQDGWINSSTFLDQKELWVRGDYITMPFRLESMRDQFVVETQLSPEGN
jgi:penicillin amidase